MYFTSGIALAYIKMFEYPTHCIYHCTKPNTPGVVTQNYIRFVEILSINIHIMAGIHAPNVSKKKQIMK